jgi:cytochrome P450
MIQEISPIKSQRLNIVNSQKYFIIISSTCDTRVPVGDKTMTANLVSAGLKIPPTVPGLPVFGNTFAFVNKGGMPVEMFRLAAQEQGDVIRLKAAGQTIYLVSHPTLIQEMLVRRVNDFHKPIVLSRKPRGLDRFFASGILTSDYAEWRPQRKVIQPLMHTKHIESYANTMVHFGEKLLSNWRDGETRDIHVDMAQVTMWIIAETMFGMDIARTPELALAGQLGQEVTLADVTLPLPEWLMRDRNRKADKVNDIMSTLVARLMNERRDSIQNHHRKDLLTLLMQTTDEEGNPMPDRFVRDNILTLFFAGHETTANTLVWALYYLALTPHVLEILHAEVDSVLNGRAPALADLQDLPYTLMVIKETMRIEPTVAIIPRALIEDVELGGYLLEKDSFVFIPPYIVHHDTRWWNNPEQFDPVRFSESNESNIPKYAYLPFGGGPRVCIGNHFSLMEAQILLAMMVNRYQLSLTHDAKIIPLRQVTTVPKYGMPMAVRLRKKMS